MSAISGWLGSGAGIVVIGLCVVISIYMHRLPKMTHPWVNRLLICGMFAGGSALVVTTIGGWALEGIHWAAGLIGGTSYGIGYAAVVITASFLAVTVLVCLIWVPDIGTAYIAVALPLVLALPPGGFLHTVYLVTTYPAQQATETIAHWLGG